MDGPKVAITEGADGSWYWHAQAGNNEIVCHGEGYTSPKDALRGVRASLAALATALDLGAIEYR